MKRYYFIYNKRIRLGEKIEEDENHAYMLVNSKVYKVKKSALYTTAVEAFSQQPLL